MTAADLRYLIVTRNRRERFCNWLTNCGASLDYLADGEWLAFVSLDGRGVIYGDDYPTLGKPLAMTAYSAYRAGRCMVLGSSSGCSAAVWEGRYRSLPADRS